MGGPQRQLSTLVLLLLVLLSTFASGQVLEGSLPLNYQGEPFLVPVYHFALQPSKGLIYVASSLTTIYRVNLTTFEVLANITLETSPTYFEFTSSIGLEIDDERDRLYIGYLRTTTAPKLKLYIVNATSLATLSTLAGTYTFIGSSVVEGSMYYYAPQRQLFVGIRIEGSSCYILRYDVSTDAFPTKRALRFQLTVSQLVGFAYRASTDTIYGFAYDRSTDQDTHMGFSQPNFNSTVASNPVDSTNFNNIPFANIGAIRNGAPYPASDSAAPFSGLFTNFYKPNYFYTTPSFNFTYFVYTSTTAPSKGCALVQMNVPSLVMGGETYPKSLTVFPKELFFKTVAVHENGLGEGRSTIFIATSKGELKKFYFNDTTGSYITPIRYNTDDIIDYTRPTPTYLRVDYTNKYLYIASSDPSGGLWRVPFYTCGSKTTCASCVGYGDPYCGWCPLTGTCTDRESCFTSSRPSGWLQGNASNICPFITFVAPTAPVALGLQPNVIVTSTNVPLTGVIPGTFSCVFTRQMTPSSQISVIASRSSNQFTCLLPSYEGPLFNAVNESVSVALQYNQSTPVTLGPPLSNVVTLYDCSPYSTCSSCRTSVYGCGWCVSTAYCSSTELIVCPSLNFPFAYTTSTGNCPSMGFSTPKLFSVANANDIYLSINNAPDLVDNVNFAYGNYSCVFSRRDYLNTVQATSVVSVPGGINITCPFPVYSPGTLRFGLYEVVEVSAILENNGVTVLSLASTFTTNVTSFDCSLKTTCETCIPQSFSCGWDAQNNMCRGDPSPPFILTTQVALCPKITGFAPTNVVSSSSTPLTVTGQYLPTPASSRKRTPLSYTCIYSNGLFRPANFVSATKLTCTAPPIVIEGGSVQNLTLAVRYGTLVLTSAASVPPLTFVDCNAIADSCLPCVSVSSAFGSVCGWCDNLNFPILSGCTAPAQCNTTGGIRTWSNSKCSAPTLTTFSPQVGPKAGGINVTISGSNLGLYPTDLTLVLVGTPDSGEACTSYGWISTRAIYCVVPPMVLPGYRNFTAYFESGEYSITPTAFLFTQNPTITSISPDWGMVSGNTALTITGANLLSGTNFYVQIGGINCPILTHTATQIVCKTLMSDIPGFFDVVLQSDQSNTTSPTQFRYRDSPQIVYISPLESSVSSRLLFTFNGTDLDVAGTPRVVFDGMEAEVITVSPTSILIRLPSKAGESVPDIGVYYPVIFNFSNYIYRAPFQLKFFPDPNVTDFIPKFSLLSGNEEIAIFGTNLARGQTPNVTISGVSCNITYFTNEIVKCRTGAATSAGSGSIVVAVGDAQMETQQSFSYGASQGLAKWVIPVIIVVSVAVLLAILVGVVVWRKQLVQGRKKAAKLFAELDKANETNMNVLSEVMEAYTEYNTRGKFVNPLFNDKPIPLASFDLFALKTLFPDDDTLTPPNLINFSSQSKSLQDLKSFKQLLMKEEFAITFFKTMEQQPDFKLADRKYSAALFIIGLRTEIGHATNLLFSLLKDYITQKVKNGEQKTILRATSTVTEKLLTAWLAFTLHDFVSEKLSKPLFALFMAIKSQIEKGAVDSLTGSSQYTINASTILRQKVTYEHVKVQASYQDHPNIELEVNTCDSISQTIVAILFASGESLKLQNQVALFDGEGRQLKDIDGTNEKDGDWIKINTLAHYNVKEGTELKLMKKSGQESQVPPTNVYHLEKKAEHDPDQKIAPSEVFFTRMMTMREVIHSQVNSLFEAVFNIKEAPPLPIKILFDFLDRTAAELGIDDQETIHIWKNNSLALRFWVNLITNPNQLLEVTKTIPIHNSFSTIGQVLMDSCSTSESRLGPGAPASKLLYKTEVDEYKALVNKYYQHVRAAPHIDRPHIPVPQATGERLDENSALFELRNYGKKHQSPVADALSKEQKTAELKAQFVDATQS